MVSYILEQSNNVIDNEQAEYIIESCNENMFAISNECKKINAYIQSITNRKLNKEIINEIISSDANVDVWSFLDGIVIENNQKSITRLIEFSRQDNNEFQFL